MAELRITIPDWASKYLEQQVADGTYGSVDELVLDLIHQSRPLEVDDQMAELMRDGLEPGPGREVTEEWWSELTDKVRAEAKRRMSA